MKGLFASSRLRALALSLWNAPSPLCVNPRYPRNLRLPLRASLPFPTFPIAVFDTAITRFMIDQKAMNQKQKRVTDVLTAPCALPTLNRERRTLNPSGSYFWCSLVLFGAVWCYLVLKFIFVL